MSRAMWAFVAVAVVAATCAVVHAQEPPPEVPKRGQSPRSAPLPLPLACVWETRLDSDSEENVNDIAVDMEGNSYIVGSTDRGDGRSPSANRDFLLIKVNAAGQEIWRRQAGTVGDDIGKVVELDGGGNCIVIGTTESDRAGRRAIPKDAFVVKFSSDGQELWHAQYGSDGEDWPNDAVLDSTGSLYLGGRSWPPRGMGDDEDTDVFVVKFDSEGTVRWSKEYRTEVDDELDGLVVGPDDECYVIWKGGNYVNEGTKLPRGSRRRTLSSYILRLEADGTERWRRGWRHTTWYESMASLLDSDGRLEALRWEPDVQRQRLWE